MGGLEGRGRKREGGLVRRWDIERAGGGHLFGCMFADLRMVVFSLLHFYIRVHTSAAVLRSPPREMQALPIYSFLVSGKKRACSWSGKSGTCPSSA